MYNSKEQPKIYTKMSKIIVIALSATICFTAFSQIEKETSKAFLYTYISVSGKLFSKKLNVVVDFGDSPEQIKDGQEYSQVLTNKKSYAAILNYMIEMNLN